jgi:hypothetical protein
MPIRYARSPKKWRFFSPAYDYFNKRRPPAKDACLPIAPTAGVMGSIVCFTPHREDNVMKNKTHPSCGIMLALGLMVSPLVSADDVHVAVNTGETNVPLGLDAEFIAKTISTTGPRTLVIHYFAECQVPNGYVEYDIVVNKGIVAATARQTAPTNDSLSVLCANNGGAFDGPLRSASVGTVVACTVSSSGNYTVRVRGNVVGDGALWAGKVDDQSLVIEERAFSNGIAPCVNELPGGLLPVS